MAKIVLFGIGQNADVAHVYLAQDSPHEVAAFTVDAAYVNEKEHRSLPVVPFENIQDAYPPEQFSMFLPISYRGVNQIRKRKYEEAKNKGYSLISYVSSRATTWPGLTVGDNCFILENNVIQPFAAIGNDVVLWSGNHIGHHSSIGDHCFLASHIVVSGSVTIGAGCFIGVNAAIRDGIKIAPGCVIGAGALILRDTEERAVYSGLPAKLLPSKSDEIEL